MLVTATYTFEVASENAVTLPSFRAHDESSDCRTTIEPTVSSPGGLVTIVLASISKGLLDSAVAHANVVTSCLLEG